MWRTDISDGDAHVGQHTPSVPIMQGRKRSIIQVVSVLASNNGHIRCSRGGAKQWARSKPYLGLDVQRDDTIAKSA